MEKTYEQLKWEMEILDEFIEKAYEGLIIIDRDGKIIKFKYEKFLDVKEEDVIGKHVTEVMENTRLHIVLKTGTPEIGDVQNIKGHNVVTSRIPIIRGGEVVGAVVHPKPGAALEAEALAQFVARELASYKVPAQIWFDADPLPKLGSAKIDKVALRGVYRALYAATEHV